MGKTIHCKKSESALALSDLLGKPAILEIQKILAKVPEDTMLDILYEPSFEGLRFRITADKEVHYIVSSIVENSYRGHGSQYNREAGEDFLETIF